MKPKVVILGLVVGAFLVSVAPAQAGKWTYGNGPADLWTVHPPGASQFEVCTTRIHGRVGLHSFGDPSGPPPTAPPPPYAPVTVNVYTGAPGTLDFATAVPGGLHPAGSPDGYVLPPVASVTTAAPKAVNPQEQYGPDVWIYAAAPFAVRIPAGTITPGDDVVVQKDGYGAAHSQTSIEEWTAVACTQSAWRGLLWDTSSAGNTIVKQTPTRLSVGIGTGTAAQPISTYVSDCLLLGNFDARVHYNLLTWPANNSVRAGLLVNNPNYPSPNGSLTVERTSFGPADVGTGENYVLNAVDPGGAFLTLPTAARMGDLRARQQGAVVTTYYRDGTTGGKWRKLGTSPAYMAPVTLSLQVWGDKDQIPGAVKVRFTNFALSGACV